MVEEEGAAVEDAEAHYGAVFFCSRDQEPELLRRSPLAEEQPNKRHPRTGGEPSGPGPIAGFDRQALRTSRPSRQPGGRSPHLTARVSPTGVGKVDLMAEVVDPDGLLPAEKAVATIGGQGQVATRDPASPQNGSKKAHFALLWR